MKKILMVVLIAVIAIFGFAMCSGSGDSEPKKTGEVSEKQDSKKKDTKEESGPKKFKVGDIVETDKLKVTFLSKEKHTEKYLEPKKGFKYVKCTFEFENISDSEQLVSMFGWSCYADGYDMEQEYFEDTLDANLAPGTKAKGSIYFEVPKDAKDIEIRFEDLWTDGEIIFKVK